MISNETKEKLIAAETLDEVKDILKDVPGMDPNRVYEELKNHRSDKSAKLDLDELDAVSGGWDRDWTKDGCAATCEWDSWCWSNDRCGLFDVTYLNFYETCPDGHEHVYRGRKCIRCGATLNDTARRKPFIKYSFSYHPLP